MAVAQKVAVGVVETVEVGVAVAEATVIRAPPTGRPLKPRGWPLVPAALERLN